MGQIVFAMIGVNTMDTIQIKFQINLLYFALALAFLAPITVAAQNSIAARLREAVQTDSGRIKSDSLNADSTQLIRTENIEQAERQDPTELKSTLLTQKNEISSSLIAFFRHPTTITTITVALLFGLVVLYQRKLWRREIQAMNEASADAKIAFNKELREKELEKEKEKADIIAEYESRMKTFSQLGDLALEDLQRAKRMLQKKQEEEFAENLSSNILLRGVQVKSLDYFDNFVWELNPKINVLLGRNGYGKSYLLRSILSLLQNNDEKAAEILPHLTNKSRAILFLIRDDEQQEIHYSQSGFQQSMGRIPVLAIPDARFVNKARGIVSTTDEHNLKLPDNAAYHFLYQEPYEPIIQIFLYQLCIDYLDHDKKFDSPIFELVQEVTEKLTGRKFTFHSIEVMSNARFRIEVITEGNEKNPLPLQQISQGTISILAIFGLIHSYLSSITSGQSKAAIKEKHAIIFIDEIDAHLHPIWQQKIINILREHFPNVQFILTAHNPLVVAGCLDGEVAVMRKEKKNKFSVVKFEHDFIGWYPEEIYHTVFEVEGKDESYLFFNALYGRKSEIENDIEALKKLPQLSPTEEAELQRLYNELLYAEKAHHKQDERLEYNQLVRENNKLKRQLAKHSDKK